MRHRSRLPIELRTTAFSTRGARALGISAGRLGAPDLHHPFHGVHATAPVSGTSAMCSAYAVRMRPDAWFSEVTAAQLWDMPLPRRFERPVAVHVSVLEGRPAPRGRGVVGHRSRYAPEVQRLGALRVSSRADTWCDLAAVLSADELTVLAESFMAPRAHDPDLVRASLRAAIAAPGRRHRAKLTRALDRARARVRSPRETTLRLLLVDAGLPEPQINPAIWSADGRYLGEGDLAYPDARVLLEYEGDQHRTDRGQFRYDIVRRERFEDAGWSVIRVTGDDLDVPERSPELIHRVRLRLGRQAG